MTNKTPPCWINFLSVVSKFLMLHSICHFKWYFTSYIIIMILTTSYIIIIIIIIIIDVTVSFSYQPLFHCQSIVWSRWEILLCKFASDEQNFAIITPTCESKVYLMQLFCKRRWILYSRGPWHIHTQTVEKVYFHF